LKSMMDLNFTLIRSNINALHQKMDGIVMQFAPPPPGSATPPPIMPVPAQPPVTVPYSSPSQFQPEAQGLDNSDDSDISSSLTPTKTATNNSSDGSNSSDDSPPPNAPPPDNSDGSNNQEGGRRKTRQKKKYGRKRLTRKRK
jgi:hypothetical protein